MTQPTPEQRERARKLRQDTGVGLLHHEHLVAFENAVAQALADESACATERERERCAQIADIFKAHGEKFPSDKDVNMITARDIAAAIRTEPPHD